MIRPASIKVLKGLILHLGGVTLADTLTLADTIASPFLFH